LKTEAERPELAGRSEIWVGVAKQINAADWKQAKLAIRAIFRLYY
jgi:hypothetical protein